VIATESKTLGVGSYTTRNGRQAKVYCIDEANGLLIGVVDISDGEGPVWIGCVWLLNGRRNSVVELDHDIGCEVKPRVKKTLWFNYWPDGPGLLRNSWEECLIEASRDEREPLCRMKVEIDCEVGEGLQ